MQSLDLQQAIAHAVAAFERVEATGWSGVAAKLSRFGLWEFEDYTDERPKGVRGDDQR